MRINNDCLNSIESVKIVYKRPNLGFGIDCLVDMYHCMRENGLKA